MALTPAIAGAWSGALGGGGGLASLEPGVRAQGGRARRVARAAFNAVMGFERRLVAVLVRIGQALIAPARDLHTGDAQGFLLFLAGVAVLGLVLPLLR